MGFKSKAVKDWARVEKWLGRAILIARRSERFSRKTTAKQLKIYTRPGARINEGYIARVENGRIDITWKRVVHFANAFGWRPYRLVELAEFIATAPDQSDRLILVRFMRGTPYKI